MSKFDDKKNPVITKNSDSEFEKNNQENSEVPSTAPKKVSAEVIENLHLISEVFEKIESETAETAEKIFDYLIDVQDENIFSGEIPLLGDKKLDGYIKILSRLFKLSRKNYALRIINRKTVEDLDKKTYAISMCFDGGVSLDVLCDVVNTENQARTPTASPVKVTVTKAFAAELGNSHSR